MDWDKPEFSVPANGTRIRVHNDAPTSSCMPHKRRTFKRIDQELGSYSSCPEVLVHTEASEQYNGYLGGEVAESRNKSEGG